MPSQRSRKRVRDSKDSSSESESSLESRRSRRARRKHSRRKSSRREKNRRGRYQTPELPEGEDPAELLRAGTSSQHCERRPSAPAAPDLHAPLPSNQSTVLDSSVTDVLRELVKSIHTDGNSERYPTLNVVPDFDPTKRNQSIDIWITKVNECAKIYNWTERQIIHYALPKLVGLAQKWYQGLPSLLFTWTEWQHKLRSAFPCDDNYGRLLTEMLACRARFGDNLEEYYYEKMGLMNRCNIIGKNAIDCLLFGIEDRSVRTSAEAVQFNEPDKLLVYLRNVRTTKRNEKFNATPQASSSDNRRTKSLKHDMDRNSKDKVAKCYNCGTEGHPYYKCKHPIKRCQHCHKVGHLIADCPNKAESENKTVLNISKEQDNDIKYFKIAKVNGQALKCFIDFGSQITMLRESDSKTLNMILTYSELPILRGFGNSLVHCIGKCNIEIEIDLVKACVEALIVPDHLLKVSLLVGQTFTEQNHVVVYKTKDELIIKAKTLKEPGCVELYVSETVTITDCTDVAVHSNPSYEGSVLVEPGLCSQPQKMYDIMPCILELIQGKAILQLSSLVQTNYVLNKGTLLSRALPITQINCYTINKIEQYVDNDSSINIIDTNMLSVSDQINQSDLTQLTCLLNKFRDCFAFSTRELGCITNTKMDIKLSDTTPVVYRPYRMPFAERQVVRDMVQELEDSEIIRPSTSNYASPVLLVKKKSGEYRLCIDYRALNKKTIKEHYPIPRIDDQLDSLSGYKYYTTLDLMSGYYQLCMSETSKHLTAFITPDGHYEFNRMPFGLVNAPSNFQRAINNILGNARFKEAFAYMDDVIIPSRTIEEGFRKLKSTLELFRTAGITLKLSKCNFLKESIDYLGFEVCAAGIRPGKSKINAVDVFPRPTDQHKVRQFLGLCSFFRRFIRGFSSIARPLTQLLKKDAKWHWADLEEHAFIALKGELVKRPILAFYNPASETQLHTDASKIGIAGILLQRVSKDAPFNAVAYYSRQTSPEESRFTSYDLETLAVASSLQRFRTYLLGIPFTIVTDCNSLRATFEKRDILPRVARWWNIMQEYDFKIIYKSGSTMSHVDALSRNPVGPEFVEVRCIETKWIATVQHNDPELQRIISILKDEDTNGILDIKNNFVIKRGLLYRKTETGDRWVVPKGVRWQILKAHHDDIGHYGFDKTYDKIKSNFWFAKMRRFIKKYVESCLQCAHSKIPAGKKAGELHPIPKVERPFHTLHIDHLGPFVRSKKKNAYLLLIVDAFTKYIILAPVKNTKSVNSISALKNYFHTFGVPTRIISDRGTSFTSKRFEEYLRTLGIKHVLNAVATPRANGQVERYNRTVLASLTAANHNKPEHLWDECVPEIQWGLNNTLNKGIGKTPAQALFGVDLVGTPNSLLNLNIVDDSVEVENNIENIREEISQHVEKNQLEQKKRFDKGRKKITFKIGDLVRVEREIPSTGKSRKLVPKLRGPYRIVEVFDNDRYKIEDTPLSRKGSRKFTGVFSVDKIHPWLAFNREYDSDSDSNTDKNED